MERRSFMGRVFPLVSVLISILILRACDTQAQTAVPPDVAVRKVNIYSEGVRMTGYVYMPKSAPADRKLPAILMGHGWGGVQASLRQDAIEFSREGYLVLT